MSRETCPENRRQVNISITDGGINMFYRAHDLAKKAVSYYFEDQISE